MTSPPLMSDVEARRYEQTKQYTFDGPVPNVYT